jgi:hypothetical protein
MMLYHFTDFHFLKVGGTILKEGLKPAVGKQGLHMPPHGVVWLTTETENTWVGDHPKEGCRIKLFIPSSDKRLVRWETWLRKHGEHELLAGLKEGRINTGKGDAWKSFWCYFGTVPLSMFRKIEFADPEKRAAYEANTPAR